MRGCLTDTKIFARLLGLCYVSGILYMGLWPNTCKCIQYKELLDIRFFSWQDFTINIMGFIPLGYLLMLNFGNREKAKRATIFKRTILATLGGGVISLFLEVSQYYVISGRQSSLFDWIANTLGTLIGIATYLVLRGTKEFKNECTFFRFKKTV